MINLMKNKYNWILGILFGFVLAQMVMAEGYAFALSNYNEGLGKFKILSFVIFILTVALFNTKKFRKIHLDRLSIYLSLSVLSSIIVSIEGTLILCTIFARVFPNLPYYLTAYSLLAVNMMYLVGFIVITLFVLTFILLVNKKVKYIKFLISEVKLIKDEGFGRTIKVKGEDELAELCESINNMSVELGEKIDNEKRIENNKNELITNISHDLKTPLTSIIGYLDLLNSKEIDEKTKDEYIKIAYNKSLRLKALVNELFEYTKLANNEIKLEKSRVNIAMLLNQVVGESIINFIEKDVNVVLDNPYSEAFCDADSVQILRVFENLIRNAEKYGDSDSEFRVSLNIINKKILISFMNQCNNLEEDDLSRFFDKFYREDKSRHKEGSGLGLAIVKRIIDLHDGTITAEKIDNNIQFNIVLNQI